MSLPRCLEYGFILESPIFCAACYKYTGSGGRKVTSCSDKCSRWLNNERTKKAYHFKKKLLADRASTVDKVRADSN